MSFNYVKSMPTQKKIINTQFKIPCDEEQMQTGAAVVAKSIVNESESTLLDKL